MSGHRRDTMFYRAAERLTAMYPPGQFPLLAPDGIWYARMSYLNAGDRCFDAMFSEWGPA